MKYYMKKIILSGLIGLSSLIGNMSYQPNVYAEQEEIIIGEPMVIDLSKVTEVKPGMYHNQDISKYSRTNMVCNLKSQRKQHQQHQQFKQRQQQRQLRPHLRHQRQAIRSPSLPH